VTPGATSRLDLCSPRLAAPNGKGVPGNAALTGDGFIPNATISSIAVRTNSRIEFPLIIFFRFKFRCVIFQELFLTAYPLD
jgi:hypothetical protein